MMYHTHTHTHTHIQTHRMSYFNVAIVGDACVGKSKFCDLANIDLRCVMKWRNKFSHFELCDFEPKPYVPTISRDIKSMGPWKKNDMINRVFQLQDISGEDYKHLLKKNDAINLMFHEISGAERYKHFRAGYYADVEAFIVIHKGNPQTWIDEIRTTRPDAEIMTININEMQTQRDAYIWMTERFGKCVDYPNRPEFPL